MILSPSLNRLLLTVAIVIAAFLVLPIFIVLPVSMTPHDYISIPNLDELSLRHFHSLIGGRGWIPEAASSVFVATVSAVVATGLGSLAAFGLWLVSSRWTSLVRLLLILPMIVPQVLAGLSLYRLAVLLDAYDTYWFVIAAHSIVALPFVFIVVSVALSSLDIRIVHAARSSGANLRQTLLHVIVPMNSRAIASGALLAFIISWDEIVVTLFVSSRNVYTVPRRIWDGVREILDPSVAAAAAVMIVFTICVFALSSIVSTKAAK